MILVGLTGSVGMGKSTIAGQFRSLGAAVHDADAAVHSILATDRVVKEAIAKRWPEAVVNGEIHRHQLGSLTFGDADAMTFLEQLIHPRVKNAEVSFLQDAANAGKWLAVLDIPLLFETGGEKRMSKTVVVTAPYEIQRERVLARPSMTEEKFNAILARQMPDAEKQKRADYVIHTDKGLDDSLAQVKQVMQDLEKLRERMDDNA